MNRIHAGLNRFEEAALIQCETFAGQMFFWELRGNNGELRGSRGDVGEPCGGTVGSLGKLWWNRVELREAMALV